MRRFKRDVVRGRRYRNKMNNDCANPACKSGISPEAHHIIPIKDGGRDIEENMICLCRECHQTYIFHADYQETITMLYTWKFFQENLLMREPKHISRNLLDLVSINNEDVDEWEEIPLTRLKTKKAPTYKFKNRLGCFGGIWEMKEPCQ